jgi:hypothetical protein
MQKKTKVDLLLDVLSDHEWHWGDELASTVSWRFGATIKEARYRRHPIETKNEGRKWKYRLLKV